jgi:hypothetical protein
MVVMPAKPALGRESALAIRQARGKGAGILML